MPRVTYIGGFGLVHDTETLIRAAVHYVTQIDDRVRFDFFGAGIKWNSANSFVKSLGLSEKITLHGYIPKEIALSIAKKSDVLIAAVPDSPIFEFGINLNKIYLYIAAGVPIVFAGNIPLDIISENKFGASVEAANHVGMAEKIHQLTKADVAFRREVKDRMQIYIRSVLSESVISLRYHDLLLKTVLFQRG